MLKKKKNSLFGFKNIRPCSAVLHSILIHAEGRTKRFSLLYLLCKTISILIKLYLEIFILHLVKIPFDGTHSFQKLKN